MCQFYPGTSLPKEYVLHNEGNDHHINNEDTNIVKATKERQKPSKHDSSKKDSGNNKLSKAMTCVNLTPETSIY